MAEEIQFNKPERFNPNKNHVGDDWRLWKKEFLIYLELTGAHEKLSEKGKAFLLLNLMGTEAIKAKENMTFNNSNEQENMEILLRKFDEYFDPPLNEIVERYKFFSRRKNDKESIDDYTAVLQKQAMKCNFGNQINKFIIDMIILSTNYYVQQYIFALKDISLPDVIKLYKEQLSTDEKIKKLCLDELKNSDSDSDNSDEKKYNRNKFDSNVQKGAEKRTENIFKNLFSDNLIKNSTDTSKGAIKKNNESINNFNDKQHKASTNKFEDCQWCGLKHNENQCPHNSSCTNCDTFPHNICFNCKQNPHNENCYFKQIISLPKISEIKKDSAFSENEYVVCANCSEIGHYHWTCNNKKTTNQTSSTQHQQTSNVYTSSQSKSTCSTCGFYHPNMKCPKYNLDEKTKGKCTCGMDYPHTKCLPFNANNEIKTKRVCSKCARSHAYGQCPAYNKRCSKCNQLGHYNWACKNTPKSVELEQCPLCEVISLQYVDENNHYCHNCRKYMHLDYSDKNKRFVRKTQNNQRPRQQQHRRRKNHSTEEQEESPCCIS